MDLQPILKAANMVQNVGDDNIEVHPRIKIAKIHLHFNRNR